MSKDPVCKVHQAGSVAWRCCLRIRTVLFSRRNLFLVAPVTSVPDAKSGALRRSVPTGVYDLLMGGNTSENGGGS